MSHFKMFSESKPLSTAAMVRKNLGFADDDAIESLEGWRDHCDEAHARLSELRKRDQTPTAEEIQSACSPLHALIGKMSGMETANDLSPSVEPPVDNPRGRDSWGEFFDDQQRGDCRGERKPGDYLARSDQSSILPGHTGRQVSHVPKK